jgi:hypothetical protein
MTNARNRKARTGRNGQYTERASTPFSHTVGPGIRRLDCLLAARLVFRYPKVGRLWCCKFLLIQFLFLF